MLMKRKFCSVSAVLLSAILLLPSAVLPAQAIEQSSVVEESDVEEYSASGVSFYSGYDVTIYSSSSHSPLYITVTNSSYSYFNLYVRMYDPSYSSSDPLWSDLSEGGLAPGSSRTYYVGSNITKVAVRGITGPGEFSYSY